MLHLFHPSYLHKPLSESDALETDNFNFDQNYFELFDLPVSCEIDAAKLRENFMQMQRQYHPDRFASATGVERRRAVQIASHINGAHQTIDIPLKRAEYCLQLAGLSTDAETDAKMDPMFLMQQMELREALEEIASASDPYKALESARDDIDSQIKATQAETSGFIEQQKYDDARESIRRWQFLEKLAEEAGSIEAQLDDA